LTPYAPIVRFSSNEVVKYSSYSNVRQYLAAQFFLGSFPSPVPPTSPFFVRPSSRPEGRSLKRESAMFCPPDGPEMVRLYVLETMGVTRAAVTAYCAEYPVSRIDINADHSTS
jgi:hypothetical protein